MLKSAPKPAFTSPSDVNITGGSINDTPIGTITPNSGVFTTLSVSNDVTSFGNFVIGTSGKGIDFSSDPSAVGMTSELLDDYEEGTFTPTVRGSGTAGTYELNSSLSYSRYTKIGRLVTIQCQIILDSAITAGGSANLQVSGLPFAKAGSSQAVGSVYFGGVDFSATASYIVLAFTTGGAGSVTVQFLEVNDNSAISFVPVSGVSATDAIVFSISYIA